MLEKLDTPAGHMIVCVLLILIGAGLWKLGYPKADAVIDGAVLALGVSMRGQGGKASGTN